MNSKNQGRRILVVASGLGFLLLVGLLAPPAQITITSFKKVSGVKLYTGRQKLPTTFTWTEGYETPMGPGVGPALNGENGAWSVVTGIYPSSNPPKWQETGICHGNGSNSIGFFHSQSECDCSGPGISGSVTSPEITMPALGTKVLQSFTVKFDYLRDMNPTGNVFQGWLVEPPPSTFGEPFFTSVPMSATWTSYTGSPVTPTHWAAQPKLQIKFQAGEGIGTLQNFPGVRIDKIELKEVYAALPASCGIVIMVPPDALSLSGNPEGYFPVRFSLPPEILLPATLILAIGEVDPSVFPPTPWSSLGFPNGCGETSVDPYVYESWVTLTSHLQIVQLELPAVCPNVPLSINAIEPGTGKSGRLDFNLIP